MNLLHKNFVQQSAVLGLTQQLARNQKQTNSSYTAAEAS